MHMICTPVNTELYLLCGMKESVLKCVRFCIPLSGKRDPPSSGCHSRLPQQQHSVWLVSGRRGAALLCWHSQDERYHSHGSCRLACHCLPSSCGAPSYSSAQSTFAVLSAQLLCKFERAMFLRHCLLSIALCAFKTCTRQRHACLLHDKHHTCSASSKIS